MATVADCQIYECDRCHSTVLCGEYELTGTYHWKRYYGGELKRPRWLLILCDECEPKSKAA